MRAAIVLLLTGCIPTGTHLGARTPPAGTSSVGFVTRFAAGPNAVPLPQMDVTAAYSPTDDTSLHVRAAVASLGVEALGRWRAIHARGFHLALAPAIAASYWPASRGAEEDPSHERLGPGANLLTRLSALASIELGDFDLELAAFGGMSRIVERAMPAGDDAPNVMLVYEMQGVVSIAGAALGASFPIGHGTFRPTIEWMRFLDRHAAADGAPAFEPVSLWTLSLAWDH